MAQCEKCLEELPDGADPVDFPKYVHRCDKRFVALVERIESLEGKIDKLVDALIGDDSRWGYVIGGLKSEVDK